MITSKCELSCPFCYGPSHELDKKELSVELKKKLVFNLFQRGVSRIIIAGGEPLLSKDLLSVCKYAKSEGVKVALQTSGQMQQRIKPLIHYLDWVGIPLDGVTLKSQRLMRTSHAHFNNICSTANIVNKYKSLGCNIGLKIGTVISKHNLDELSEMAIIVSRFNPNVWKLYEVRKRGKGKSSYPYLSVNREEMREKVLVIREKHPQLNVHLSLADAQRDNYAIINPDSWFITVHNSKESYRWKTYFQ